MTLAEQRTQEIEEFLVSLGIVPCITPEDVGTWTPSYLLYFYYINWKLATYPNAESCLTTSQFVEDFPRCKARRSTRGYTDFKVFRGVNLILTPEISKQAKHLYAQEQVWRETAARKRKHGLARIKRAQEVLAQQRKEKKKATQA